MDGIKRRAIAMTRGTFLRLEDGRRMQIHVWEGELWITQEGDRRDYLVKAGESFEVVRGGAALLYALQRAVVTMTAPEPARFARRITLTPAGTVEARLLYDGAEDTGGWLGGLRGWLTRAWVGAYTRHARPTTAAL